ncbi:acyl transferase/acyl hydrolase/lysophospholipase [Cladorrhinum sp. PSN332]|nr:acyl transferase/acyl hydrolase/lysophospholipase [Cladorrhinum sp. PSN332]
MVTFAELPGLEAFPKEITEDTPDGKYAIASLPEVFLNADGPEYKNSIWFQTPPLTPTTIQKLHGLQLFAESHDQAFCDQPLEGTWTWFEIALLQNKHAQKPRVKDGIELVWRSHMNHLDQRTHEPAAGLEFEKEHDIFRLMEDGNVIAVRLCARFQGWEIWAQNGYLVLELGPKVKRASLEYGSVVTEVKSIQSIFEEVNSSLFPESMQISGVPNSLFKAEMLTSHNGTPLRVLSLDGGGVRGVASLMLLDAVMKKAFPEGTKPCEVFDMIGGTSTGGFIAIMLGRLRMSIADCLKQYGDFMKIVFNPKDGKWNKGKRIWNTGAQWDPNVLERVIKQLVREQTHQDPEQVLLMDEQNPCKVFVMAVSEDHANNRAPVVFRSYMNPLEVPTLPGIKLWEAARATSAAPFYFPPMKIDNYSFVDGGLHANNPLGWLWNEVLSVFGPARPTSCFLSLGTGVDAAKSIGNIHNPKAFVMGISGAATNTEIVNVLFRSLINAFAPKNTCKKYWRFNVGDGMPNWVEGKDGKFSWVMRGERVEKKVGDLDDVSVIEQTMKNTAVYIEGAKEMIGEAAGALLVEAAA